MQRRTERLVLWALAIVVAGVCVRASVWQYGRAEWKQQYLQSWQAALDSAAQPLRAEDIAQKVETPKRVEVDLDRSHAFELRDSVANRRFAVTARHVSNEIRVGL